MGSIHMGGMPEDQVNLIDRVVAGTGATLVRADDPESFAVAFSDRLGAELVESADAFDTALDQRLQSIADRTDALAALEIHARLEAEADIGLHELTDLEGLRQLVGRIRAGNQLIAASRAAVRDRVGTGTGLAVHPDALRSAADELLRERDAVSSLKAEITALEAELGLEDDQALDAIPPPVEVLPGWDDAERRSMAAAVALTGVALVLAVVILVVASTPLGFVLPVAGGIRVAMLSRQHSAGLTGYDEAADNLAAVAAMTERAYGGSGRPMTPELAELDRRRDEAADRLRYAEGRWTGLVGTEVPVESIDDLLRTRDASHHIGRVELDQTPSIKAAAAHVRRLTAQWKLAWYALDRPVPNVASAEIALEALEAEGIERVVVPTYERRCRDRSGDRERFEELAAGRGIDELRAAADPAAQPIVVCDAAGVIGEAELQARTAVLPADVRVIVVGPDSEAGDPLDPDADADD